MSEQVDTPDITRVLSAIEQGNWLLFNPDPDLFELGIHSRVSSDYPRWIAETTQILLSFPNGEYLAAEWAGLPSPLITRDPCSGEDCYCESDLVSAVQNRNSWLGKLARNMRPERQASQLPDNREIEQQPKDARTVFVVHGRDDNAREAMFAFLRAVGLEPLEFNVAIQATGKPMPYIGEILDSAFGLAQAVVVLMTPDDEARLQSKYLHDGDPPHERNLTPQARPNVLFEAGMAMGRCPDRTIIVEIGTLRGLSDISGLHTIRMDDTSQRRQALAQRLIAAGCPANLVGTDWHNAGRFANE